MFAFPEDLLLALLSEWLPGSLLALSHLDVACCNRASRSCWLEVIRRVRIEEADAAKPMGNFLTWLHDRTVFVSKLWVTLGEESWVDLNCLSLSFRTTSLECYYRSNSKSNSHRQPIPTLLSFFPRLTTLDVDCRYLVHDTFPDLSRSWPLLRKLSLRDCWAVNMVNATVLLAAISPSLEELHCDPMDEQMVEMLMKRCRSLKKLSSSFRSTATAASVVAVCVNNPRLVSVDFRGRFMTNELILAVLVACPSIKEVVLGDYCEIDATELLSSQAVFALDYINLRSFVFRLFSCESSRSKRCCEIMAKDIWGEMEFFRTFSVNTSMAIRGVTFSEKYGIVISVEELRMLADVHGHSLEKCELYLWRDTGHADLHHFLSHCPNMVDLSLTSSGIANNLIDDAAIRNLPRWCPRIAKLELIDCAGEITDASFSFALERWSANSITTIHLQGCRFLTDAVLPVIERCCPQLASLYVPDIGFSKEALLQFVVSMFKNKAFFSVDNESRSLIADELREKHFGLWRHLKVAQLE